MNPDANPTMGVIKFQAADGTPEYYKKYDEGGIDEYRFGAWGACMTASDTLILAGHTARTNSIGEPDTVYAAMYGIDSQNDGTPLWGLGSLIGENRQFFNDVQCESEVVYSAMTQHGSLSYEHLNNRCQFMRVDVTDATTRTEHKFAYFSDWSKETCNLEYDSEYLYSLAPTGLDH